MQVTTMYPFMNLFPFQNPRPLRRVRSIPYQRTQSLTPTFGAVLRASVRRWAAACVCCVPVQKVSKKLAAWGQLDSDC